MILMMIVSLVAARMAPETRDRDLTLLTDATALPKPAPERSTS